MYLPNNNIFFVIIYVCGAAGMDILKRKIPNEYILLGFLSVFLIGDCKNNCIQIILVSILIFPLYTIHVVGAADIKLLCVLAGVTSAFLVIQILIKALVLTAIATGIIKSIFFVGRKKMRIEKFPFTLSVLLALFNQVWG